MSQSSIIVGMLRRERERETKDFRIELLNCMGDRFSCIQRHFHYDAFCNLTAKEQYQQPTRPIRNINSCFTKCAIKCIMRKIIIKKNYHKSIYVCMVHDARCMVYRSHMLECCSSHKSNAQTPKKTTKHLT